MAKDSFIVSLYKGVLLDLHWNHVGKVKSYTEIQKGKNSPHLWTTMGSYMFFCFDHLFYF